MPFEDLPNRLAEVRQRIDQALARGGHGQKVRIIAVTKTHGPDASRGVAGGSTMRTGLGEEGTKAVVGLGRLPLFGEVAIGLGGEEEASV